MVRDIATEAESRGGTLPDGVELGSLLDRLAHGNDIWDRSYTFIFDSDERLVQQFPLYAPIDFEQITQKLPTMNRDHGDITEIISIQDQTPYLVAVQPIRNQGEITSYAVYVVRKQTVIISTPIEHRILRLSTVAVVLICGWGILYLLTRRLLKPIQEAADAAKQIVAGNYHIDINNNHNEKEIYELMVSFKEMADRLEHLESLRSQLFLGVTHELKTPIASISGLVQAVKDGVVSGEEAQDFLEMSLKESNRLQKMVEDLLTFNSFAANMVKVTHQNVDLVAELHEMVVRWKQVQEKNIHIVVETMSEGTGWQVLTDPVRLEQIIINLLNNARDAMDTDGSITIRLFSDSERFRIEVQDTGMGIPVEEQEKVFESFYRGSRKRTIIHGLGIGLPFSRLIARSLGGDLILSKSNPDGTQFILFIPIFKSTPSN